MSGLEGAFRRGRREGVTDGFRVVEFDIRYANAQGLSARTLAFLRYAAAATRLARRGFDLVLASSTPLTVALPALLARRRRGTPFIFEIRDPWPELPRAMAPRLPWPLLPAMERLADAACRNAAAVVALTEGMAETARARGAARVEVVPQGADLALFGPHVAPWRPAGMGGGLLALYAGAHGRANGLDQLLDAAALLRGEDVRLLLVGEGSEKPRLVARVAAEGLPVDFLDPLPKPRLAGLMAGVDVGLLCLAPVAEFAEWTAPNKLAEGLAAGLPMLVNVPGRAARLVEGAGAGLAVPPGDAAALAAALRVLRDPGKRAAMGAAARALAAREFDSRAIAARLVGLVEEVASSPDRCHPHPDPPPLRGRGGMWRALLPLPLAGEGRGGGPTAPPAIDILMLSAAHPAEDVRIVQKEGAALAAAGFRVAHLAPDPGVPRIAFGVAIHPFPPRRGWRGRIANIIALARRAAALRPRAIHAHEPDSWLAARLAARRCGARLVLDVHEHYPSRLDPSLPRALRPVARWALRLACRLLAWRADAVVVAKDGLDDAFGGGCIKLRNYAPAAPVAPRAHREGPLTLVHLGALGRARGAFTMLEALARLPPATRLLLIGRFTDGSEAEFRARAAALGLTPRIDTHAWMPREAALALAAGADIALVLFQPGVENHRLALPHKLFDAMLAGLPVIVPDFAAEVASVVREAGCGLAVDVADPAAVARAVLALGDPPERARLGGNGRAAALGRFGWEAEARRLVDLYGRLLTPAGATP